MKWRSFFLFLCASLFAMSAGARGGNEGGAGVGNGGDIVGYEFAQVMRDTLGQLLRNQAEVSVFVTIPPQTLKSIGENVEVSSKKILFLRGREVDAINYPDTLKIEVNRGRWMLAEYTEDRKRALVLHELLGLLRIEDHNYAVSGKILPLLWQRGRIQPPYTGTPWLPGLTLYIRVPEGFVFQIIQDGLPVANGISDRFYAFPFEKPVWNTRIDWVITDFRADSAQRTGEIQIFLVTTRKDGQLQTLYESSALSGSFSISRETVLGL